MRCGLILWRRCLTTTVGAFLLIAGLQCASAQPLPPPIVSQPFTARPVLPTTTTGTTISATARNDIDKYVDVSDDFLSNTNDAEQLLVEAQLASLAKVLSVRDKLAVDKFDLDLNAPRKGENPAPLVTKFTISRLGCTVQGAMVRATLQVKVPATRTTKATTLNAGYDLWFPRSQDDGTLGPLGQLWKLAEDAGVRLAQEASRIWASSSAAGAATSPGTPSGPPSGGTSAAVSASMSPNVAAVTRGGDILTLVAEYRGGRWVALRAAAPWKGIILDSASLSKAAQQMLRQAAQQTAGINSTVATANDSTAPTPTLATTTDSSTPASPTLTIAPDSASASMTTVAAGSTSAPSLTAATNTLLAQIKAGGSNVLIRPWLQAQMNRYRRRTAGIAYFVLQRGSRGWIGIDSVFEPAREATDPNYARDDNSARVARGQVDVEKFALPEARLNYAQLLSKMKLANEAADELEKTAVMQPDLVPPAMLKVFENARQDDPQSRVDAQRELLTKVGYAPEHPQVRVPILQNQFRNRATPLVALRLSLEYSRLGYEKEAQMWFDYAMQGASNYVQTANVSDKAWFNVLRDQLKTRFELAPRKPGNIIRSNLFTVRCTLNDPNTVQLLAGLEAAQYTIYKRFQVPMSNTEVILWSSQSLFQAYTTRQAGRDTSEFVTALTLTQLVNADVGPVVLGEEINFYADSRADSISTIAHEYGHIAVRTLAAGREVPDWLNEGIATSVEGGYENYLTRVRNAKQRKALLSMADMQQWNVDGERAFLAYSQANSMIDFIESRWGSEALLDVLQLIGRDVAPDDAIKRRLTISTRDLYMLWLRYGIK